MKKILWLLLLNICTLWALPQPMEINVTLYQSNDSTLTLHEIAQFDTEFKTWSDALDASLNTWVKVTLPANLPSGNYLFQYMLCDFDIDSFSPSQHRQDLTLFGEKFYLFSYHDKQDSKVYYFHVNPQKELPGPILLLLKPDVFSTWADTYVYDLLIAFFVFGLIMMTAIYNGVMYYYNKERAFLYYMFMQIFMLLVLLYHTNIVDTYVMRHIELIDSAFFLYSTLSLFVVLFALLFVKTLFETQKHLPRHDKIIKFLLGLVLVDLLFYTIPFIMVFHLYSIIALYFLWIAYLRLKQGFKPAIFFLIGWVAMLVGVFLREYYKEELSLDPMLLSSTFEAILLSIALSYKLRQITREKEEQKELLVHQNKLASMGEMIGNIAHQWRQPLTRLSYILMNIARKDTEKKHFQKLEEGNQQLEFMSQTIDDFKDFYASDKEKEDFSLAKETQKVLDLVDFEGIMIDLDIPEDSTIHNYKNEYKQVILNLLSNAQEAFTQRAIKNPAITIMIDKKTIIVQDNAGGIMTTPMQKIFEPYFSSKEEGMGIGLYMSKIIVEKNMSGKLDVQNDSQGAVFTIDL